MGDDEARQILLDNLDGAPLADPRQLKFTTGRRKAFWARNVVALGLSSGFIEPLESTSIHMVQSGIYRLLQHFPDSRFSAVNIEAYNRRLGAEIELIRDFVILHYHATQRADTPFWRTVASMPVPDSLSQRVETFRDRGLLYQSGADEYFSQSSWLAVMFGQGIRPRGFNPLYGLQNPDQGQRAFSDIARRYQQAVSSLAPHDDFLKAKGCWAT
jgi:tryptophan halogenase